MQTHRLLWSQGERGEKRGRFNWEKRCQGTTKVTYRLKERVGLAKKVKRGI